MLNCDGQNRRGGRLSTFQRRLAIGRRCDQQEVKLTYVLERPRWFRGRL